MDRRTVLLVVAAVIAAVGVALVFVYVQNANERAAAQYETVEVLEAVQPIAAGESVEDAAQAGKLQLQPVPQSQLLNGYQTSLEGLEGSVALTRIYPGEQIITSKFGEGAEIQSPSSLPIPEGQVAISVNLSDTARVAGFVQPGSQVAIFYTGPNPGGQQVTRMLLSPITVIGVGTSTPAGQATEEGEGGNTEELPTTLMTLAVSKEQAERVTFASSNGELSFALLTESSQVSDGPGVSQNNLFG